MAPIPADNFRHMIKRDPGEPNLGEGTPAVPLKEEGKTIDITMAMGVTTPGPLAKPDSFVVTNTSDHKPYAGGIKVKGMRMSTTLALVDGHGKEHARIFKLGGKMGKPASYEICGYRPFVKGQMSLGNQPGDHGRELFSWAKVDGDGFGSLKLRVKMLSSPGGTDDYVETYISEPNLPEGGYAAVTNVYPPVIFRKTDGSYVAFAGAKKTSNPLAGPTWSLHIAPGMDPCLIICFIAILDEYEKKREG